MRNDRAPGTPCRPEPIEKWLEHVCIGTPADDRAAVDRPTHLSRARGFDRPCRLVIGEAAIVPFETTMRDDAARLRLEIGDQFLVSDVEHHTLRQHAPPMIHQ